MARHDLNKVIKIGEELFRTKGYYHTGTEEILQQANFPRSSFYYHFTNKEGFAAKVLASYGQASVQFYKSVLTNEQIKSPAKRLGSFFEMLSEMTEKREFKSQCLIQKMSGECAATNEIIREAANTELAKLIEVLYQCVKEGQESGEFRSDIDTMELAQFLHAQIYGSNTIARLAKSKHVMDHNFRLALDYLTV